jgi:hypothetical protein
MTLRLRTLGVLLCLAGLALAPGADVSNAQSDGQSQLSIHFDGGNAYVFAKDGRLYVGPVKVNSGDSMRTHDMRLELHVGDLTENATVAASTQEPKANWPLVGYEMWICADSEDCKIPSGSRAPMNSSDPELPCGDSGIDESITYDLAYVPDLTAMHPSYKLRGGWKKRLSGRMVLSPDMLQVRKKNNCFVFKRTPLESKKQGLADGEEGVRYQLRFSSQVVLHLKPLGGGATKKVPIWPKHGKILLKLKMPEASRMTAPPPGEEIADFRNFYALLDDFQDTERFALIVASPPPGPSKGGIDKSTPGSSCPPARFRE